MKRTLRSAFLFLVLLVNNAMAQPVLSLSSVITGLAAPMQVVHAGDNTNRIFIPQKFGSVRVFDRSYVSLGTFLTVAGITTAGERGLLSMVFHPDYANNGFFYVYYTNANGDLELARYKVSANPNVADANSKAVVITIPHPTNANHNGGTLHFGADGFLYLSTGDGGGSGDVPGNAQNTAVLLGKILRLNVNTSATAPYYTVPADNPFGNEVYAYGLRNPFRWSFDRLTNDMWIGDVGQDSFEEIDHRLAGDIKGTNFGWRCYEGNSVFNSSGCGPVSNYTFPVFIYPDPVGNVSVAVTGGTVYRGETYIGLRGYYLASDYYSAVFYKIKYDSVTHIYDTSSQVITPAGISNFGETEDGELYVTCLNNGTLYRIVSNGAIQYTFTGNGSWDVADNWSNKTIPPATLPAGSEIVIRPAVSGECVLNTLQTISPGSKITVQNDKQFRIAGNLTIQ